MKKIKQRAYFLLFLSLIIVAGLSVSCSDDNTSSSGKVELLSFGPSPIPRGSELQILGSNLEQVESVVLPGAGAISEFTKKSATELRLIVPKTAEDGRITLNVGSLEITSLSILTINGMVELTGFSPLTAKAGEIVRLEGKDFDFVQEVVFTSDIHILKEDFISQSKEVIEVVVPIEAQSGSLAVNGRLNGSQVTVYFEEEINVVLPTIASFSPETIRAGSVLTVTGKDFDLVESVGFGGGKTAESFTMNNETSITVTVPKDAQDGSVVLTVFSGVKVSSAEELVMVVPTITSITPNPVKVGEELTVTGTDLDLISSVAFGDGKQPGQIQPGGSATEIKIPVPGTAKDGKIIFTTFANKTVDSPEDITIIAEGGAEVLLWEGSIGPIDWSGSHLAPIDVSDLAPGMVMGIEFECPASAGYWQLRLMGAWWGGIPTLMDTYGGGSDQYVIGFDESDTNFEFVLSQEDIDVISNQNKTLLFCGNGLVIKKVYVKVKATLLWEGSIGPIDWSGSHLAPIDVSDLAPGKILGIDFQCPASAGYWQLRLMGAWWGGIPTLMDTYGGGSDQYVIGFDESDTNFEFVLSQEDIDVISNQNKTLLFCGNGLVIERVYVK